ncbi:MAG: thioredoxin domain-containing protein [Candidatus Bathyarchaeota archaeon]|jgi:thiol-disulfide isomerase/thioredoxin/copper chaperone CopZ
MKSIPIVRMDCPTCIPVLEREVLRLEGVENVKGYYMTKTLKVTYDPSRVQLSEIEAAIERIGYQIAYKRYPGPLSKLRGLLKRDKGPEIPSLTDAEFPGKALHASKDVAVLFSSPTCPTCQVFKPKYRELAEKLKGRADLYEMDITSTRTWRDYDILSIPTVLLFRAGKVSERFTALPRIEELEETIGSRV